MPAQLKSNDNIRRLRAQIHIARKALLLDDDTYRAALVRVTGKKSSADLNLFELSKVVADFKRLGWSPRTTGRLSPKSSQRPDKTVVDKIRALWITMGNCGAINDGSEPALEAWVKRHTAQRNKGIGVDRVDWLERDPKMAAMVLESLKKWHERIKRTWCNEDLALISRIQGEQDRAQADVVAELLAAQRIMWWPLFAGLFIEAPAHVLTDRRLRRDG